MPATSGVTSGNHWGSALCNQLYRHHRIRHMSINEMLHYPKFCELILKLPLWEWNTCICGRTFYMTN